jgi:DNA primase
MTKEELKAEYSMREVIGRYGLTPNRAGLIRCPFHQGDREPSMKIYEKDFNCYGCGANGDIFTFVQMMEEVSFKEAFQILGGTYEKPTFASRLAVYRSQKRREMTRKEQKRTAEKKTLNNMLIGIYRRYMERSEPYSDVWCDCYNAMQYQLYLHGELNGLELR